MLYRLILSTRPEVWSSIHLSLEPHNNGREAFETTIYQRVCTFILLDHGLRKLYEQL
jgi:hypothetical protein